MLLQRLPHVQQLLKQVTLGKRVGTKQVAAAAIVVVAAAAIVLAVFRPFDRVTTLTAKDSGATLDASVGAVIAVDLQEFGSAGYVWQIDDGGSPYLEPQGSSTREPSAFDGRVGAPVTLELRFRAVRPGTATLRLSERHPWESGGTPAATFAVTVRVRE